VVCFALSHIGQLTKLNVNTMRQILPHFLHHQINKRNKNLQFIAFNLMT
jgi:hypothetical protein